MAKRKFTLSRKKYDWAKNRDVTLKGEPVRVNDVWAKRKANEVEKEVRAMHLDISKTVKRVYDGELAKDVIQDIAMDASLTSQVRITLNALAKKWNKRFNLFSKSFSTDLMSEVASLSGNDLNKSLEKLSGGVRIDADTISDTTREIIKASTQQSTSLIKSISQDYISEVQEGLMRAIVSPGGSFTEAKETIDKLLSSRYKKYRNKAKNTTLDQIRKAYSGITDNRMRDVGVEEYEWVHSGGSVDPRDYHKNVLNGEVFSLDEPPVIDPKTGEKGHPGDAVNCKCFKRPIVRFGKK